MSKMLSASMPPITKEAYEALAATFPAPIVQPGMDQDQLMYDAGCHHVVEWIRQRMLHGSVITGSVDATVNVRTV